MVAVLLALAALAAPPADAPRGPRDLVIVLAGDVAHPAGQHDEALEALAARAFDPVRPWLDAADLRFCNLEAPFTERSSARAVPFPLIAPPHRLAWVLDAGFDLLSLANNHVLDAGRGGLADTLAALTAARAARGPLWWAGAALDPPRAFDPVVFTPPGKSLRVALVALANDRTPGVAFHGHPAADRAVRAARRAAELVIVSVHFGREYHHVPTPAEAARLRRLVRAGADLVVAHHPHVARGVERYRGALILHGLGNLSFGSLTTRHHATGAALIGLLARVEVQGGRLAAVHLTPLHVNNLEPFAVDGHPPLAPTPFSPQPLRGAYAQHALDALDAWTAAIPGNTTRLDRDGDGATLTWP